MDGCSEFRIFWNIYLPLILPAAITLGIMTFQSGWNSFMWPMIVLNSKEMMTIQVGLSTFQYQYNTMYGPLMAGTVIATIPTLLVFVLHRSTISRVLLSAEERNRNGSLRSGQMP